MCSPWNPLGGQLELARGSREPGTPGRHHALAASFQDSQSSCRAGFSRASLLPESGMHSFSVAGRDVNVGLGKPAKSRGIIKTHTHTKKETERGASAPNGQGMSKTQWTEKTPELNFA